MHTHMLTSAEAYAARVEQEARRVRVPLLCLANEADPLAELPKVRVRGQGER